MVKDSRSSQTGNDESSGRKLRNRVVRSDDVSTKEAVTKSVKKPTEKAGKKIPIQQAANEGDAEFMNFAVWNKEMKLLKRNAISPRASQKYAAASVSKSRTAEDESEAINAPQDRIHEVQHENNAADDFENPEKVSSQAQKRAQEDQPAQTEPAKKSRGRPRKVVSVNIEKKQPPQTKTPTDSERVSLNTGKTTASAKTADERSNRKRKKTSASHANMGPELVSKSRHGARAESTGSELQGASGSNDQEEVIDNEERASISGGQKPPAHAVRAAPREVNPAVSTNVPGNAADTDHPDATNNGSANKAAMDDTEYTKDQHIALDSEEPRTETERVLQSSWKWLYDARLSQVFFADAGLDRRKIRKTIKKTKLARKVVDGCEEFKNLIRSSQSPFLLLQTYENQDLDDCSPEQLDMVTKWRAILDMVKKFSKDDGAHGKGTNVVQNLYGHVIPALTSVLRSVLKGFSNVSQSRERHYHTILAIVETILFLGRRGEALRNEEKDNKSKAAVKTPVVKEVKDNIIAPLKKASDALSQDMNSSRKVTQAVRHQQTDTERRRQTQIAGRHALEREAILRPWRKQWTDLHTVRMTAAAQASRRGYTPSWRARLGPRQPVPEHKRDTTAEYVAKNTAALDEEQGANEEWTEEANEALLEACYSKLGPDMWVDIVFDLCIVTEDKRGNRIMPPLGEFSVTEIVSRAIWARDQLLALEGLEATLEDLGTDGEWVHKIWDPRVRPALPGDEKAVVVQAADEVDEVDEGEDENVHEGDDEDGHEGVDEDQDEVDDAGDGDGDGIEEDEHAEDDDQADDVVMVED